MPPWFRKSGEGGRPQYGCDAEKKAANRTFVGLSGEIEPDRKGIVPAESSAVAEREWRLASESVRAVWFLYLKTITSLTTS
jgi:hypothetical protein